MKKDFLINLKKVLKKRVAPGVLAGVLVFAGAGVNAWAFSFDAPAASYEDFKEYTGIKVFVNGRYVEFNDSLGYPVAMNGRTYIPVRAVSEAFHAFVYWDQAFSRVLISKHGKQIRIKLGEKYIEKIDDLGKSYESVTIEMDAEAFVRNERTYIPLRALFENFDMDVTWAGETQTVYVVGDYEKNTEWIDFKDYKVLSMQDLDLSKNYSKILYDGAEIDKEYLNVLKNSNEYKIIEDDGTLNIFSYQFLFDLNYLYKAHTNKKNNTSDNTSRYPLYSIDTDEYEYLKEISFIDDRFSYFSSNVLDSVKYGMYYSLDSVAEPGEFDEIDAVVNDIVNKVNLNAETEEDKVKIVNEEMKKIMEYGMDIPNIEYGSSIIHRSLINPKIGTCEGYAITFKYIMDKLGIDCIVVTGINKRAGSYGLPHSWNEVLINGEWKVVDVSTNDVNSQDYILLTDYENIDYFKVFESDQGNIDLVKYTLKLNEC